MSITGKDQWVKDDPPEILLMNMKQHRLRKIINLGRKKFPQKHCRLCYVHGRRKDTSFVCDVCNIPLCKEKCFENYHIFDY